MDQKTADASKQISFPLQTNTAPYLKIEHNFKLLLLIEAGTTKGGLESADVWGDADDVSDFRNFSGRTSYLTKFSMIAHE